MVRSAGVAAARASSDRRAQSLARSAPGRGRLPQPVPSVGVTVRLRLIAGNVEVQGGIAFEWRTLLVAAHFPVTEWFLGDAEWMR